jgi:hypothetical protein
LAFGVVDGFGSKIRLEFSVPVGTLLDRDGMNGGSKMRLVWGKLGLLMMIGGGFGGSELGFG